MIIGKNIISLKETESTNIYAKNLLKKHKVVTGSVIITDFQKTGKGHFDSVWESNRGENLLFSIVIFPDYIYIDKHFYLSKFVSLALCKYIRQFVRNSFIKWPNDIICNGKKICGTLIENSIEGSGINNSVIGIGMNINQREFSGNFKATSLQLQTGREFDLRQVLKDLIHFLNIEMERLAGHGYEEIDKDYISMLYNYERWKRYKDKTGEFEGKIIGIGHHGELIVLRKNDDIRTYGFKEISLL